MTFQNQNHIKPAISTDELNALIVEARKDNSSGKGCWYEVYDDCCVICGRGNIERVRRYGPKPEIPSYHYIQRACPEHFM